MELELDNDAVYINGKAMYTASLSNSNSIVIFLFSFCAPLCNTFCTLASTSAFNFAVPVFVPAFFDTRPRVFFPFFQEANFPLLLFLPFVYVYAMLIVCRVYVCMFSLRKKRKGGSLIIASCAKPLTLTAVPNLIPVSRAPSGHTCSSRASSRLDTAVHQGARLSGTYATAASSINLLGGRRDGCDHISFVVLTATYTAFHVPGFQGNHGHTCGAPSLAAALSLASLPTSCSIASLPHRLRPQRVPPC